MLERRAGMLASAREFFAKRGVMEVDTPVVVNAAVTDVHIHSAQVRFPDSDRQFFLHTSPEYAMKRLLAAGSGDIYQICHVARGLERGRLHNAEFTLIEWYRLDFSLERLMDEVAALVQDLVGETSLHQSAQFITYAQAFRSAMNIDPLEIDLAQLRQLAAAHGFSGVERDEILDFFVATRVGPGLGHEGLVFLHRYPSSQAALAQLDPADGRCALRFELYWQGVELANGFKELASAEEQQARFQQDNLQRREHALPQVGIDAHLLAALSSGLPDCAGVALGFDRLVMLSAGAQNIDEVLPFPIEHA